MGKIFLKKIMSNQSDKIARSTNEIDSCWNNFGPVYMKNYTMMTHNACMTFLNLLDIYNADDILEIGCGDGIFSIDVATRKRDKSSFSCCDLANVMVSSTITKFNHVEKNYNNIINAFNDLKSTNQSFTSKIEEKTYNGGAYEFKNLNSKVFKADAENLPSDIIKDNSYDVIFSSLVLQIVNCPEKM